MENINNNNNRVSEKKIIEILRFIYGENTHHVIFYYPLNVDDIVNAIYNTMGIDDNTSISVCMDLLFDFNLRNDAWFETWRYQYFTGNSNHKTTFTDWDTLTTLDELVNFIKTDFSTYTSIPDSVSNNLTESEQNIPEENQPENINELIDTFNQYLDSDECQQELEKLNNKNNNINNNTMMNNNEEQQVKYKFDDIPVGTIVRIKDLDWYNKNKEQSDDTFSNCVRLDRFFFTPYMSEHCGKIGKVVKVNNNLAGFVLDVDNNAFYWTEDMFDVISFPQTETIYSNEYVNSITDSINEPYEMVNHPSHYNSSSVETIEKMIRIWGYEKTAIWCEMTAFKYRDRIGNKPGNSLEQEMGKIKWYEAKADELYNKMKSDR